MALRGKQLRWDPRGTVEAFDGSNTFKGSMLQLSNLIPAARNAAAWHARPASQLKMAFPNGSIWGSFNWGTPAQWGAATYGPINALLVVGNMAYGMVSNTAGAYNGLDTPFALNLATNAILTVTSPQGSASFPTSPSALGDWTPPTMDIVGSRIIITHPGYATPNYFGWMDISSFSDSARTGSTHTTVTVDTLSSNVLQAGWQIGMTITGAGIPANTIITAIAANGLSVTLSQSATATASGVGLTVAGGTKTSPLYAAGNTNGAIALSAVPVAVKNFSGRAWYAVPGAGVVFSDSGFAQQVTNATQALTFTNGLDITAFGGLPFYQTTGAVLQALVCFQGDSDIQQITGDAATFNLAVNDLTIGVGTLSPLSICNTPQGLAFVAPDGVRILNFAGQVSTPIGDNGKGMQECFLKAVNLSRICAAYNQNVLRISLKNGDTVNQPMQEWWYDFSRQMWSGPHTFPAAQIKPYQLAPNAFLLSPVSAPGTLYTSTTTEGLQDTWVEAGQQMVFTYQTTLLPDNEELAQNAIVEQTLACQIPYQQSWTATATDEHGNLLDTVTFNGANIGASIWGQFNWGAPAVWGSALGTYHQVQFPWQKPLVFKQASFLVTGQCAQLVISTMRIRYHPLGYILYATAPQAGATVPGP